MASPRYDASPAHIPAFEVHRLDTEAAVSGDAESVVMVKLTDEMIAAIQKAQRSKTKMSISIQQQGGVIRLGPEASPDTNIFRFAIQSLPGPPADVIASDKKDGYRATSTVHMKYQIQATDKSFAETREKAQKLIEEENCRKTKDMNRQRRDQRPVVKRVVGGSSSSTTSGVRSPYLKPATANDPNQRISPSKFGSSTGSNAASAASNGLQLGAGAVRPSMSPNLKADLMKRKLRLRVVHLVVTGRFSCASDVIKRLRKDGLHERDDEEKRIEAIVSEVSERGPDDKLLLKSNFNAEVDSRWPWFTTEEKVTVRRTLQPSTMSSTGFAPTRKSGIDRMQAPSQQPPSSTSSEQKRSPDRPEQKVVVQKKEKETEVTSVQSGAAKTLSAGGMIGGGKKVSPQMARTAPVVPFKQRTPQRKDSPVPPAQTNISVIEDLIPSSTQNSTQKRKAHVPPTSSGLSEKRARNESASPPEDPTNNMVLSKPSSRHLPTSGGSTGGSSVSSSSCSSSSGASSRLSSPCSLASPSQPSQDWSKCFAEAKSVVEAEKYFQCFCDEYPEYMKCFGQLNKVASEFRVLSERLENARRSKTSEEIEKVERDIHNRYQHYEKDTEFLKVRQRHADLRSKLNVLKRRISAWEERTSELSIGNRDNLFAM